MRTDPTGLEVKLGLPSGQVLTAPDGSTIMWFTDGWYEIIYPDGSRKWGYWNAPPAPKNPTPKPKGPKEPKNPSKTAEWCEHMGPPVLQACAEAIVVEDVRPLSW